MTPRCARPRRKDQLAEVTIVRDEKSVLSDGDRQDVLVDERAGIIVGNRRHVVTNCPTMRAKRQIGALVEKEARH
jgi:hypothetical protein